ncbi:hypothetical protein EJB05_40630, partial [Eragrostis curvula]
MTHLTKEEKRSTMTTTSTRTLRTRLALPRTTPVEMEDTASLIAACTFLLDLWVLIGAELGPRNEPHGAEMNGPASVYAGFTPRQKLKFLPRAGNTPSYDDAAPASASSVVLTAVQKMPSTRRSKTGGAGGDGAP